MQYSVIDIATGRILRFGECQQEMLGEQAGDVVGEKVIVGAYSDLTHYAPDLDAASPVVADVDATPRPELPALVSRTTIQADGVDAAVITGLPVPCAFMIDGEAHETTDGTIEVTATVAGAYVVAIDAWPFLPWQTVVTAR